MRPQNLGSDEQEGVGALSSLVDLASGNPNPRFLPAIRSLLDGIGDAPRLYGTPAMDERLVAFGRQWFAGDCPPEFAMNLASGAVDAIERLIAAHLLQGDIVAVEDPCFLGAISALRFSGMEVIGVPMDHHGMIPDRLERALETGAKAVVITPRAQNPTGCCLSASRARELRAVLSKFPGVLVVTDDHFALLANARYHSVVPENATHWALIRSVSKAMGPDLRFAFVASDELTSTLLRRRLNSGTCWVSHLIQDLVTQCFQRDSVRSLVDAARQHYGDRRSSLTRKLSALGLSDLNRGCDGLNLWIPIEKGLQTVALGLASCGWMIRTGESFSVQKPNSAIRVTISNWSEEQESEFVSDLKRILHEKV